MDLAAWIEMGLYRRFTVRSTDFFLAREMERFVRERRFLDTLIDQAQGYL
jgi:hypothetical protein